jgi:serine/threonine-protein kinase
MAVSTFASTTDLLDTLRVHKLLQANQLKTLNQEYQQHAGTSPQNLLRFAVEQGLLTRFQADLVLTGSASTLALPPYVLLDNAGSGYAGQVYQARGENDDTRYVIKILARGTRAGTPRVAQVLKRFANFRHPAVLEISFIGTVSERTYLVWPDPKGGQTLEQLVQDRGRLPAKQVVHYGLQAARALHACQEERLFHGLFKAADIHIDAGHKVVLKDLGMGYLLTLSREDSAVDTMTSLGQLASGLDWSSPESLLDQRDRTPQGDQYSLGCILYYALSGQVPFPVVSKVRKMMAHQTEEPPPLLDLAPDVPPKLVVLVERLMKKVPAERFADMGEVVEALRGLQGKPASTGTTPRPTPLPAKPRSLATNTKLPRPPSKATTAAPAKKSVTSAPAKKTVAPPADESGLAGIPWVAWAVSVLLGLAACIIGLRLLA